jgi:hypothetical protein
MAGALALSRAADLGEVGITGSAATAITAFFGNLDEEENVELEALPQPLPLPVPVPVPVLLPQPESERDEPEQDEPESDEPEPEPEAPPGPMAEFDEVAVLVWLSRVPGLTAAQLADVNDIMADAEYEGAELVGLTVKSLRRLLKGTAAEEAVPLLLAARDDHLTAAAAEAEQRAAAAAEPLVPPDEFVCAISQQLMVDPVTADEGVAAILDSVDWRRLLA